MLRTRCRRQNQPVSIARAPPVMKTGDGSGTTMGSLTELTPLVAAYVCDVLPVGSSSTAYDCPLRFPIPMMSPRLFTPYGAVIVHPEAIGSKLFKSTMTSFEYTNACMVELSERYD